MHEQPPIRSACAPVSGYGGMDMRSTGLTSVKDCRLSNKRPPNIRSKTPVGLTSGFVAESDPQVVKTYSKNARRKARRYGRIS